MENFNIKNSGVSIDKIKKYCSIISRALIIPYVANPIYEEYHNIQGLYNYDISAYKSALINIRKKRLLSKCGLSSTLFSNFLFKKKIDNRTYNFGKETTKFTHVIVTFNFQENLYFIDPHMNCMFYDENKKLLTLENSFNKKDIFFLPNKKNFYKSIINTKINIDEFTKKFDLKYDKDIFFVKDIEINNIKCVMYKFKCDEKFLKKFYEPLKDNLSICINWHPNNKENF